MTEPAPGSTPEGALAQARERARAARDAGEYAEADRIGRLGRAEGDDLLRLHEWAFIEADPSKVHSTRRLGAPITVLKRALLRLLVQHNNELTSQQTRFNVHLLGYVARLERRVARLEELAEKDDRR